MELTHDRLCREASEFSFLESTHPEPSLYGITDGKAVGTYLEAKFLGFLRFRGYVFQQGNAAKGLDFPSLGVDIKVTSVKQPQSSCPFRSIRQKVYGLGYGLVVFIYSKSDNHISKTATLTIMNAIYISANQTADFMMTQGIRETLSKGANIEEVAAFMQSRSLTDDYDDLMLLAQDIMANPPAQGYLTISPALQWRLQYGRAIGYADQVPGVVSVYRSL